MKLSGVEYESNQKNRLNTVLWYWNGRKTFYELIQEQICLLIYVTLGTHSHIMAAGDSGIPVCPGSCWGGGGGGLGGMLLLLNPQKLMSLRWATEEATL